MKRCFIQETMFSDEAGHNYRLLYWLLEGEMENSTESSYGAEIEKWCSDQMVEHAIANGLSNSLDIVLHWIHSLANHTVTPMTLLEVCDDFLSA